MGKENENSIETPKFTERLRMTVKATGEFLVSTVEAIKEFNRTHRVDIKDEEKPSGWQDPDDDDIQFLHNGAPYNR
jgi:hypothetical protein